MPRFQHLVPDTLHLLNRESRVGGEALSVDETRPPSDAGTIDLPDAASLVVFRSLDWQQNRKRRSLIGFAFYRDRSAEQFNENLDDMKAKPNPTVRASR